ELFTVEQNVAAFHGIYLDILSRTPARRVVLDETGEPVPFSAPAEGHVPGRWTESTARAAVRGGPGWATDAPVRATVRDPASEKAPAGTAGGPNPDASDVGPPAAVPLTAIDEPSAMASVPVTEGVR
ncbi:transferase, partial [Streptomyces rochei]|nr:transferase [Streptomyces rochei]